jgi:hypothetical protein
VVLCWDVFPLPVSHLDIHSGGIQWCWNFEDNVGRAELCVEARFDRDRIFDTRLAMLYDDGVYPKREIDVRCRSVSGRSDGQVGKRTIS